MVAARPIAKTPRQARYPAMLPYGDRVLLVWSDNRDQNRGYELYAKTLSRSLDTLAGEMRITDAPGESIDPTMSFGPSGEVGILFGDWRSGESEAYFTRLTCVPGARR